MRKISLLWKDDIYRVVAQRKPLTGNRARPESFSLKLKSLRFGKQTWSLSSCSVLWDKMGKMENKMAVPPSCLPLLPQWDRLPCLLHSFKEHQWWAVSGDWPGWPICLLASTSFLCLRGLQGYRRWRKGSHKTLEGFSLWSRKSLTHDVFYTPT